jgi:hypothetical protein
MSRERMSWERMCREWISWERMSWEILEWRNSKYIVERMKEKKKWRNEMKCCGKMKEIYTIGENERKSGNMMEEL